MHEHEIERARGVCGVQRARQGWETGQEGGRDSKVGEGSPERDYECLRSKRQYRERRDQEGARKADLGRYKDTQRCRDGEMGRGRLISPRNRRKGRNFSERSLLFCPSVS